MNRLFPLIIAVVVLAVPVGAGAQRNLLPYAASEPAVEPASWRPSQSEQEYRAWVIRHATCTDYPNGSFSFVDVGSLHGGGVTVIAGGFGFVVESWLNGFVRDDAGTVNVKALVEGGCRGENTTPPRLRHGCE